MCDIFYMHFSWRFTGRYFTKGTICKNVNDADNDGNEQRAANEHSTV